MSQNELVASYPELCTNDVNVVIQYATDAIRNDVLIDMEHII